MHDGPFKEFIPLRYMHLYRILHMIGEAFIDGWQELDLLARNVTQHLEPDKWEEPNLWYSEQHSGYCFYENTTNGNDTLFKCSSTEEAHTVWTANKSLTQIVCLREANSLQRLHKATYKAREFSHSGIIDASPLLHFFSDFIGLPKSEPFLIFTMNYPKMKSVQVLGQITNDDFQVWSKNMGHTHMSTTLNNYG